MGEAETAKPVASLGRVGVGNLPAGRAAVLQRTKILDKYTRKTLFSSDELMLAASSMKQSGRGGCSRIQALPKPLE